MDEEPKRELTLEEMHQANIASAQALLETIEKVKARQEEWQVVLAEALAKDKQEELECERAFKRVALHQLQTISQGAVGGKEGEFETWLNSKGASIGSSKVQGWFHDDSLVRSTPYCAVLPLPTNLSQAGEKELEAEVASMGLSAEFYVENFPFQHVPLMQSAVALGILGKGVAQSQGKLLKREGPITTTENDEELLGAQYLQTPCRNGSDVLALVKTSEVLKLATKSTLCLFLNDAGGPVGSVTALRRLGERAPNFPSHSAILRCIVIGGFLVAVEGVPSSHNQKSGEKPFDTVSFADHLMGFVRSLIDAPASCLFKRSVQLIITAHTTSSSDALPYSFYLLDVSLFEGHNTDHFQLNELLLLAEYQAAQRDSEDINQDAPKLLVRMAGSPWAEIRSVITKNKRAIQSQTHTDPQPETTDSFPLPNVITEEKDITGRPNTRNEISTPLLMAASAAVATAATIAALSFRKR